MIATIVCVDDQPEVRKLLASLFRARGCNVVTFDSGDDADAYLRTQPADLLILDVDLGPTRRNGIEVCRGVHAAHPQLPIIMLTGNSSVDDAVRAVKAGAVDFITKDPYLGDRIEISVDNIERMLEHVRARARLETENQALRVANERLRKAAGTRWEIVGKSPSIAAIVERITRVAAVPRPVLILGPRGTGKELVARAIHNASPRATEPFVTINCAAVAESLLESELFGHEEGAFTGATKQKEGKFELADGGTLFLDEIGNMSLEFQAKILRVLEYQRFERVAGAESIQVNVRVIAATNANLKQAIVEGRFRADLYDRLAFEVLRLPSLAERLDDVPLLATHFLESFRREVAGITAELLTPEALAALVGYGYPGNIRELKNIVERAAYLADGGALTDRDILRALPEAEQGAQLRQLGEFTDDAALPLPARIEAFEEWLCKDALQRSRFRQKEAAQLLGISYDQFRQRFKKYGLGQKDGEADARDIDGQGKEHA